MNALLFPSHTHIKEKEKVKKETFINIFINKYYYYY